MSETRPIILMDDQPVTCPECGRRLELSAEPIAEDEDGPIFAAHCPVHGIWRVQDDPEDQDEAEDPEDPDE